MIDNNRLVSLVPKLPMNKAFAVIDNLIAEIIFGITDTITKPSLINLDFADVKAVMGNGGVATLLFGEGTTANPDGVVKNSLKHPLLNTNYKGAIGALIHITGGSKMSLRTVQEITAGITNNLNPRANIIMGATVKPELGKHVKVLTIMTGLKTPKFLCPIDDDPRDFMRTRAPRSSIGRNISYSDFGALDDRKIIP